MRAQTVRFPDNKIVASGRYTRHTLSFTLSVSQPGPYLLLETLTSHASFASGQTNHVINVSSFPNGSTSHSIQRKNDRMHGICYTFNSYIFYTYVAHRLRAVRSFSMSLSCKYLDSEIFCGRILDEVFCFCVTFT